MVAALFDLDGVVVDTESQYSVFWNEMGKKYFPDKKNFADEIKGQTLVYIISKYFSGIASPEEIKQSLNEFEHRMQFPYIPGVLNYIRSLREANTPLAVVTSSDMAKMNCLYAAHPEFQEMFTHIFTSEDAQRSKPAPDCYLHAAEVLQVPISDCVVFEDSLNGLQDGRSAGAKVVGLTTSLQADVIRPLCDFLIPDFTYIDSIKEYI